MRPIIYIPWIATVALLFVATGCPTRNQRVPAEPTPMRPADPVSPAQPERDPRVAPDTPRPTESPMAPDTPMGPDTQRTPGTPAQPGTQPGAAAAIGAEACPLHVDPVEIDTSDTDRGIALTFTTDGPDVADLRARVRSLASLYETRGGQVFDWYALGQMRDQADQAEQPPGPPAGVEPWGGLAQQPLPRAHVTVEEVDDGARIVLTPVKAGQRDALREHIRMHRERFEMDHCPAMHQQQQRGR